MLSLGGSTALQSYSWQHAHTAHTQPLQAQHMCIWLKVIHNHNLHNCVQITGCKYGTFYTHICSVHHIQLETQVVVTGLILSPCCMWLNLVVLTTVSSCLLLFCCRSPPPPPSSSSSWHLFQALSSKCMWYSWYVCLKVALSQWRDIFGDGQSGIQLTNNLCTMYNLYW